jgi:putative ABC transport system substrate-binding protein
MLLAAPGILLAQTPGGVWRIAYLWPLPGPDGFFREFVDRLHGLGYVEGRNLSIESRWAAGKMDRLPELAHELRCSRSTSSWRQQGRPRWRQDAQPVRSPSCS